MDINLICNNLHKAANQLALQNAKEKNDALNNVVTNIERNRQKILDANLLDVKKAQDSGMSAALVERLSLDNKKIDSIIESIKIIISQTDPIGEELAGWNTPNGMTIRQVRVPLGVIAIIYESRPNVTVDAFSLAYKSGNAILLRGSSSAYNSNKVLVDIIKQALCECETGIADAIELAPCQSHDEVEQILTAVGQIDVALPRGGAKLINTVVQTAKVPVIQTGAGVCHLYVDSDADCELAAKIAYNAKTQRPGACNAIECIVVHKDVCKTFIPLLSKAFNNEVVLHADASSLEELTKTGYKNLKAAQESDFGYEFLDFECAIKTVSDAEEAINFINEHNTKHSEAIVTNNRKIARLFQSKVDAACVYVNASTRFTDGGEFGFGAELGISTQKLHARGPMGIKALTTTKYIIDGDGQIR